MAFYQLIVSLIGDQGKCVPESVSMHTSKQVERKRGGGDQEQTEGRWRSNAD